MRARFLVSFGLAAGLAAGVAQAGERPVVVELFTSQGCSSCPPANDFLIELADERDDVLPLGFHVTYWDRLGWKDPFSLRAATARQARYGRRFGDGSYTPEMVVDGAVGLVGSHRAEVNGAIARARQESRTAADVQIAKTSAGLSVAIGAGEGSGQVILVGFDRRHVTDVGRGENGGRRLAEANAVRSVQVLGAWSGRAVRFVTPLPEGEDAAVLLEAADGRIVGAARLPGGDS